jgi:hypothetical protein
MSNSKFKYREYLDNWGILSFKNAKLQYTRCCSISCNAGMFVLAIYGNRRLTTLFPIITIEMQTYCNIVVKEDKPDHLL